MLYNDIIASTEMLMNVWAMQHDTMKNI